MGIKIVNNTCSDIRDFHAYFVACVQNGEPLPEDLSDIFSLTIEGNENNLVGVVDFIDD